MHMKRVAVYCRVSSDDQKERETIENQVELLTAYIEIKEDLELHDVFLDDGISGTISFEDRPSGKKIIESAKNNLFDSILVYKIDRFGRDTLSGLSAVELLRKYNVEIISYTEPFDLNTPSGRYQFINYLNMAELERNNILERMFLGATRAAKQGKWLGGIVPYGYFKNKNGYLSINEDEAYVVRKIFDMYVNDKMNSFAITLYLNSCKIDCNYAARGTGKKNKENKLSLWSVSTVQRILSNTTYMGIHEYGKRSTKRKETIIRNVPPIIPEEIFEQAKLLRVKNIKMSKRNSPNRNFLLRTLIKCGECGRTFYGVFYRKSNSVYSCSGKKKTVKQLYGVDCNNINLVADDIEATVWNICENVLKNFDDYIIDNDSSSDKNLLVSELTNLEAEIDKIKGEKTNLLKLYRKNIIDDDELEDQLNDIKNEISKYADLINSTKKKLNLINDKENVTANIKNEFNFYIDRIDNLTDDEKMSVIRSLIKEIRITTAIDNGIKYPEINIEWNLSDLLFSPTRLQILSQINKNKDVSIASKNTSINRGVLLKNLRLYNNVTLSYLANILNISVGTLKSVEDGSCRSPYYYYNKYSNHFNVSPYSYLKYNLLPTKSLKDKIEYIKACYGLKSNYDLDTFFNLYKGAINDTYNRKRNICKIEMLLDNELLKLKVEHEN